MSGQRPALVGSNVHVVALFQHNYPNVGGGTGSRIFCASEFDAGMLVAEA
jgi:hypothetical protein